MKKEMLAEVLRETIIGIVRQDAQRDRSQRQLAVLLICCLDKTPQTVRGLAATLAVAKPAITRAVDTLEHHDLAYRRADVRDRRSVLIVATDAGRDYVKALGAAMEASSRRLSRPKQVPVLT